MKLLGILLLCSLALTVQGQSDARTNQCDGTPCPGGCCPEPNWFCCEDGMSCASTAEGCQPRSIKTFVHAWERAALAASVKSDQCDGTPCPNGCCPETGWVCCPDDVSCAATEELCATREPVIPLASFETKDLCQGTICSGGCCPEIGWVCCPDGKSCAVSHKYCYSAKAERAQSCTGTECTGGCCPEKDWYCCEDQLSCASSAEGCQKVPVPKRVFPGRSKQCDGGTQCTGGCCQEEDWVCCENPIYCAPIGDDCPPEGVVPLALQKTLIFPPKPCEGIECPSGCCPHVGWFCCADGLSCAAVEDECGAFNKARLQKLTREITKKCIVDFGIRIVLFRVETTLFIAIGFQEKGLLVILEGAKYKKLSEFLPRSRDGFTEVLKRLLGEVHVDIGFLSEHGMAKDYVPSHIVDGRGQMHIKMLSEVSPVFG
eukprot:maker-scaffold196_size269943-snap-gene-1.35 protein:Tk08148 transcript:maker-scaffold196_size269943-snap-gene-1.35-mRNA-1 annotation:"PREDICTED: hypothetical protein LOC100635254"